MAARPPFIDTKRIITIASLGSVLSFIVLLNIVGLRGALGAPLDFGSFLAAGRQGAVGENPYRVDLPLVYTIQSADSGEILPSPNLNPPVSLLFFRGLAGADPLPAVSTWRVISALLFAFGIFMLGWWYRHFTTPLRILWAVCLAGIWNTLALGQIYAPLLLAAIGAWLLMEKRRSLPAGILLGILIAVKPNFLFWLLLLAVAGQTRTILNAAATVVTLSLLPLFIMGADVYRQWLASLVNYPSLGLTIAGNSSLEALAIRLGYGQLGLLLSLILAGVVPFYLYFRRGSVDLYHVNSFGIVGSILISPFSWPGYTVLTLPIFLARRHWSWLEKAAATCLVFPYVWILYFVQRSAFNSILFGWLYGWGLLLLLAEWLLALRIRQLQPPPKGIS